MRDELAIDFSLSIVAKRMKIIQQTRQKEHRAELLTPSVPRRVSKHKPRGAARMRPKRPWPTPKQTC